MRLLRSIIAISICGATSALALSAQATETTTYTYDALGRLIVVKNTGNVNNNQIRSFCYDAAGNRIEFVASSTGTPAACVAQG